MTAATVPTATVLVAGIGNIFHRDDGFGPEVVRRLALPADAARVVDYGIRGLHLAYDLLERWEALVLVDAVPDRGRPGEVEVMVVDNGSAAATDLSAANLDAHGMDPLTVFAEVRALGGTLPPTYVVGCQVSCVDDGIGLSAPVAAAVEPAMDAVVSVLDRLASTRRE